MAKYKLSKPCYFNEKLHPAGDVVDFGDAKAPAGSIEVVPEVVEKARAAAKAAVKTADDDAAKEDELLKAPVKK